MMHAIDTRIEIQAPPPRVWDVIADFPRYPEWNPFILAVVGEVREGASVSYRFEFPQGIRIWAVAKILRFQPARELRWAAHFLSPRVFNGEHHFRMQPSAAGGTRFEHGEVFSGALLPLAVPLLKWDGPRSYASLNAALKRRAEAQS